MKTSTLLSTLALLAASALASPILEERATTTTTATKTSSTAAAATPTNYGNYGKYGAYGNVSPNFSLSSSAVAVASSPPFSSP
jgi:hypothetical protein